MSGAAFLLNLAERRAFDTDTNEEQKELDRQKYLDLGEKTYEQFIDWREDFNHKYSQCGGHWWDVQYFFNHMPLEKKRACKEFMVNIPEIKALIDNNAFDQQDTKDIIYTVLNKHPQEFNNITGINKADIEFIGRGDDVVDNIRYILQNF